MIWILVALFSFKLPDPQTLSRVEPAKIEFEQDTLYLGKMKAGLEIPLTFRFKNVGTSPYQIKFVNPSCSCTEVQFPTDWIRAGQEGEISGSFNTTSKSGDYQGSIVVHGNTDPHYKILIFKATIE